MKAAKNSLKLKLRYVPERGIHICDIKMLLVHCHAKQQNYQECFEELVDALSTKYSAFRKQTMSEEAAAECYIAWRDSFQILVQVAPEDVSLALILYNVALIFITQVGLFTELFFSLRYVFCRVNWGKRLLYCKKRWI